MFGGLISEMAHKMPVYEAWSSYFPIWPEIAVFTLFFACVVALADLLVVGASALSRVASGETFKENFARYGLALLPLVLTAFMAYHLYYLIHVGVYFPIVMWQNFHFEIFREMVINVRPSWTHAIQHVLVGMGLVGSLVITFKLARARNNQWLEIAGEFLPHGVVTVFFFFILLKSIDSFFY